MRISRLLTLPAVPIVRVVTSKTPARPIRANPAADWKHFSAWGRQSGLSPLPPQPQTIGLYITAGASGTAKRGMKANAVSTIECPLAPTSSTGLGDTPDAGTLMP